MSVMVSPYQFAAAGGGGGPVTRQVYSAESLSEVTNTNEASPTTLVSLTFTPDANATYVVFGSLEFNCSISNASAVTLLEDATEKYRWGEQAKEFGGPPDYFQRGTFVFYTAGPSPSSVTWTIKVARAAASGTTKGKNGRLVAMRLESGDSYAESLGQDTITGTSYVDKASVSFTGDGSDYLVLATGIITPTTATYGLCRLNDGGTTSHSVTRYQQGASPADLLGFGMAWRRAALSGSHTIKTQVAANNANDVKTDKHRILVLALSGFYDSISTALGSDSSGTDASYTDALSVTDTPAAKDHIVIAAWESHGNSFTITSQSRFRDGGTDLATNIAEFTGGNAAGQPSFLVKKDTYAAASRTWNIQRQSETTGVTTTVRSGAAIEVLQLNN